MKTIVVYYSRKGSNKYLAEKISAHLNCDIEAIRPILNVFFLMLFGMSLGIKKIKVRVEDYDRVILVGPIWMGKFIAPLKSFVKKYSKKIKNLVFVTCCGSTYEKKDEKYGHGIVFREIVQLLKDKKVDCHAFPIVLVFPEDKKDDGQEFMKTHLNDGNFSGEIKTRFDEFLQTLN
jgi:menaquinone-dependent protoporphyrinogen IX oxidase